MNYQLVCYLIMVTVFVSYVSWIWIRYGVLKSISDSYYELPKNLQFIFTLFCWGFSLPAMILGVPFGVLMFLAPAGIAFVGAAAAFQETMTHDVHMTGASVGVIGSQLAIGLYFGLWPINAIFVVSSLLLLLFKVQLKQKHFWWIEILAFLSICVAFGIILFKK